MSFTSEQCQLADEPLEPLLRLLEAHQINADVRVQTPNGRGLLRIRKGRLKAADFGASGGLGAAHAVLAASVGTYDLSYDPDEEPGGNLDASLSNLLAEDNRYSEHGVEPSVMTPLERTSQPLPSGLDAAELRVLSVVGNTQPLVVIIEKLDAKPHLVLRAARSLLGRGLIRQTTARTLHLGTPVPDPNQPSSELTEEEPRQVSGILRPVKRSIPAQWVRGSRQLSGRYSSAPPAALAEEQVQVPTGLIQENEKSEDSTGERKREPEVKEAYDTPHHTPKTLPSTPPPAILDELDDPLREEDFEAPLIPGVTGDFEYRNPLHTIDDEVVREAARGQLSDSEMPVPSSHLGKATLEQLGQLDQAIASSRIPVLPKSEPRSEKPDPEPSSGFMVESPGSVPGSQALPETAHFNPETGLPTVGRYEVLARLKSGGMGSVYMCRLSGTAGFRRLFAMKVLHGHLADEPETLDAFFHEARVLAGLHHPNVVGIVDIGTPQEPYIVLDYVEGGSLLELYRASGPDDGVGPVIAVILDALAGLQAAHNATDDEGNPLGLVHCDVTPHNLLVGVDGMCRVTDFGIARTGDGSVQGEVTRGKPGYIAPERIRRQPSDHRADLFSLGVVLYCGLTGEEPFYGGSPEETMQNVLKKSVAPPSEVGRRPPPCLDWVCAKALARNPNERFQSAEEMALQLRRIASREGLLAGPTEVADWVRRTLAPTLAARRAASQRGTVPPSERGAQSLSSPSHPPPLESSRARGSLPPSRALSHLEAAPEVGEAPTAESTHPPTDPPLSSSGNTEVLDSMLPKGLSFLKKAALYLALLTATGALIYVVLYPDAVRSFLGQSSPAAPPTVVTPTAESDPTERDEAWDQEGPLDPSLDPDESDADMQEALDEDGLDSEGVDPEGIEETMDSDLGLDVE